MDKHLNRRKRAVDKGVYTDDMLHHLSGDTFCFPDSSSDFAITDLQVAAASVVYDELKDPQGPKVWLAYVLVNCPDV